MGTRSLTYIYSYGEPVACMYRQFDGYPTGHGADLAEFLSGGKLVNGIPVGSNERMFNGMSCLAAQMVAHFKTEVGGFYLYPTKLNQACGQEYEYHVHENEVQIVIPGDPDRVLFKGTWQEFAEYCSVERYSDDEKEAA